MLSADKKYLAGMIHEMGKNPMGESSRSPSSSREFVSFKWLSVVVSVTLC